MPASPPDQATPDQDAAAFGLGLSLSPPPSVGEAVADALRDAILRGVLPPGRRLRQEELASQFGISRNPLRDALRTLQAEGLVTIDGRRGARVAALSQAELVELYELRELLEPACAAWAVERLDERAARRLAAASEAMDEHAGDPAERALARRAFYEELYGHSGRPRLVALILHLRELVDRFHVLPDQAASPRAHQHLREAIVRRDPEAAARLTRRHLQDTRGDLLRQAPGGGR